MSMAPVLAFRPSTDLGVDVPRDFSCGLARDITRVFRNALGHLNGVWMMTVQRTREDDRWRLELRGPVGRHIWIFLGRREMLPERIGEKLRTYIRVATTSHQVRMLADRSRSLGSGQHVGRAD
jgi:hypothetical protein